MLTDTSNKINSKNKLRKLIEAALFRSFPNHEIKKNDFIKNVFKVNNLQVDNKLLIIDDLECFLNKDFIDPNIFNNYPVIPKQGVCKSINSDTYQLLDIDKSRSSFIDNCSDIRLEDYYSPENEKPSYKENSQINYYTSSLNKNYSDHCSPIIISSSPTSDHRLKTWGEGEELVFLENFAIELRRDDVNNIISYKIIPINDIAFEFEKHMIINSIFTIFHDELQNLPPPISHDLMSIFINNINLNNHEKAKNMFRYN
jgi:hypothetical protein